MRTKLRKITSLCLAVIMILGVLTIAPFSVSALESQYNGSKTISIGGGVQLKSEGGSAPYYWRTSDSSIISVTPDKTNSVYCMVKGLREGTAYVYLDSYKWMPSQHTSVPFEESWRITVKGSSEDDSTRIAISHITPYLGEGESIELGVSYIGNEPSGYTWSSSNTSVATVSQYALNPSKAKVTAKKVGTAIITVTASNGSTVTTEITVKPAPISVSVSPSSITLGKGETRFLSESYNEGSYANPKNLQWSSSDTSVATVSSYGQVTAKEVGTANITVKTYNGKTATCKVTVTSALSTPQITKLENTASGIKISWNKVSGAYGYRLYYKYPGKDWKRFKDTTSTSFTDTGVSAGRTETYTIRCIDSNGNTISGYNSSGWSKKYEPVAPTITKLENTSSGIKISWNKVAGVYGYRLYYKYPGKDWKRFKDTTSTSFTDTGVSAGRTETYTIRCIDKNGNTVSGYYSNGWSKKYEPVAPTITRLENTSSGVKITWNKVAGVYGYRLYYKYPGQDWKRFKDTTATSFTDTGVKSGRTETYTIRCIDKNGNTISGYYPNGWSITYW